MTKCRVKRYKIFVDLHEIEMDVNDNEEVFICDRRIASNEYVPQTPEEASRLFEIISGRK